MPVYKTVTIEQIRIAELIALHFGEERAPRPGEPPVDAYSKILNALRMLVLMRDNATQQALSLREEIGLLKQQLSKLEAEANEEQSRLC